MLFRWDDARDWRAAYLYKVILLSVAMRNTHYIRYFASFGQKIGAISLNADFSYRRSIFVQGIYASPRLKSPKY
ncbi:hypothetical protein CGH78_00065 [Vibrio parahaemolyticus]|nr:hypothetical protein CGH78_00065 [Vibrio parahaemolyticus]